MVWTKADHISSVCIFVEKMHCQKKDAKELFLALLLKIQLISVLAQCNINIWCNWQHWHACMHCASVMTQEVLPPALFYFCLLPAGLLLAGGSSQWLATNPHGSVEVKPWMLHPLNSHWVVDPFGESTQLSSSKGMLFLSLVLEGESSELLSFSAELRITNSFSISHLLSFLIYQLDSRYCECSSESLWVKPEDFQGQEKT